MLWFLEEDFIPETHSERRSSTNEYLLAMINAIRIFFDSLERASQMTIYDLERKSCISFVGDSKCMSEPGVLF